MTDYNFDFESRKLDSSERTDSDGGGGTSFTFFDGSGGKKGGHPFDGQEKKPVDFGEPVELHLSDKALGLEEDTGNQEEDSAAKPPPNIGKHINIEA